MAHDGDMMIDGAFTRFAACESLLSGLMSED